MGKIWERGFEEMKAFNELNNGKCTSAIVRDGLENLSNIVFMWIMSNP